MYKNVYKSENKCIHWYCTPSFNTINCDTSFPSDFVHISQHFIIFPTTTHLIWHDILQSQVWWIIIINHTLWHISSSIHKHNGKLTHLKIYLYYIATFPIIIFTYILTGVYAYYNLCCLCSFIGRYDSHICVTRVLLFYKKQIFCSLYNTNRPAYLVEQKCWVAHSDTLITNRYCTN